MARNNSIDFFVDIAKAKSDFFNFLNLFFPVFSVERTPFTCLDVDKRTGFRLVRYSRGIEDILIVPSIVNRSYIFDLNKDVSVIQHFCRRHFGVFKIEWEYYRDNNLSLSDYIEYIDISIDKTQDKKISILGYCLGGIISLIYAFLYPEKVNKLILLATPIDFSMRFDPRMYFCNTIYSEYIESLFGMIPGELPNAYGIYLLSLYLPQFMMNSDYVEESLEYEYRRDFFRRIRWIIDSQPILKSVYKTIINDFYQKNNLIKGKMKIKDKMIDLSRIDIPLLNIIARYDHLIPYRSSNALEKVYSGKYDEIIFPSSHVGLSVSRKAHNKLWPKVCDWLTDRLE